MEENYPEINNEEISRINEGPRETDPFDGGVTAPLAGDDADSKAAFYSLSDSDIRVLQSRLTARQLTILTGRSTTAELHRKPQTIFARIMPIQWKFTHSFIMK